GLLRRSFGVPVRRSAPVVLAERVTDATGVVVLAVAGGAGSDRWPLLVPALAGVAVIVAVVRSPLLERFAALGEAPEAARALLGTRLLVGMTAVSAASWFCECLAAYVCVRGLRLHLSLADTIVVFSLGSLAGAFSLLPGGLGVAETSMTGLIRVLGDVPKAAAAAATVLIRLATRSRRLITWLVKPRISARLRPTGRTCSRRPSCSAPSIFAGSVVSSCAAAWASSSTCARARSSAASTAAASGRPSAACCSRSRARSNASSVIGAHGSVRIG